MARAILTDELWARVETCLPPTPHRRRVPGPHPIDDRSVLAGILFVLRSGLPWEELPAEMGAGSGMTCLRRLRVWQRLGVWERIRRALRDGFKPGEIDWRRADASNRARRRAAPGVAMRAARAATGRTRVNGVAGRSRSPDDRGAPAARPRSPRTGRMGRAS
ncbi:MAG: transposase [Candidatus Eiseniibacteriota bacterium]